MKVLIIYAVSNRESLFVTPVLRVLKTELNAETHLIIQDKASSLFQLNPYLHKTYVLNKSSLTLRKTLKREGFDYVIDLENSLRSIILRAGIAKKLLAFNTPRLKYWLYVKTKINLLPKEHKVDQYLSLLEPLGIKGDSLGLDFFLSEKDEVENDWLPTSHQNGYVAIAI